LKDVTAENAEMFTHFLTRLQISMTSLAIPFFFTVCFVVGVHYLGRKFRRNGLSFHRPNANGFKSAKNWSPKAERGMPPKEEWLRYSGLDFSPRDMWLRDRIASLFDVDQPTEAQRYLLHMASLRLTLMDLPAGAYPNHEAELRALAQIEFGAEPTSVTH